MNLRVLALFLLIIGCLQSCELSDDSANSEEYNSAVALELLQPTLSQVAYNQSAIAGRSAAVIMQYFKQAEATINVYEDYRFTESFFDDMWSAGFYNGSLASASEMKRLAIQEKEEDLVAISMVILAIEFSALTNMFGDIPFTESLQGAINVTPRYDTQKEVYIGILDMLDEAIDLIGDKGINNAISNNDLIFQGNLQAWKKLAYGLKAKFLLNQRNRSIGNDSEILALIDQSFKNHNEQASFDFDEEFNNPQYSFPKERPWTLISGDYFVNLLLDKQDPRLSTFTQEGDFNYWIYSGLSDFLWFQEDSSIPILSYTELMFMRTELLFHRGASKNEIGDALNDAINSSLSDNHISIDSSTTDFISSMSNLNQLDQEEILERIIEQAYVAYYGFNHLQSWNNYRRTGFPSIISTGSSYELNPSNMVPRRFLYPISELEYNTINVQEALSRQGGALLDEDIWIFKE